MTKLAINLKLGDIVQVRAGVWVKVAAIERLTDKAVTYRGVYVQVDAEPRSIGLSDTFRHRLSTQLEVRND